MHLSRTHVHANSIINAKNIFHYQTNNSGEPAKSIVHGLWNTIARMHWIAYTHSVHYTHMYCKNISCTHTHTRFELTKQEHLRVLISFGFWQVAVCQFLQSNKSISGNSVAMVIYNIFILFIYEWASECEKKRCEFKGVEKRTTKKRNKMYWRLMSYINCRIVLSFIKCEDTKTHIK